MSVSWHGITSLTYPGEEPLPFPYIEVTHGSWYQKPDMLLKQRLDTKKTFGRSAAGRTNAERWMRNTIDRIMDDHDWELPEEVTYHPRHRMRSIANGGKGLTFGYQNEHGIIEVGLHDPAHNDLPYLIYSVPAYMMDILNQDISLNPDRTREVAIDLEHQYGIASRRDYQPVKLKLREFYRDPWSVARSYIDELALALVIDRVAPVDTTVRRIVGEAPWDDWYENGPTLYIPSRFGRYMPDYRERGITPEEWKLFEKLMAKFRDLGVSVNAQERIGTNIDEREIIGITIDTPRLSAQYAETTPFTEFDADERGILEEHSITLSNEGLTVMCGYLASDERFARYQARQMKDFIGEMMDEDDPDEPQSTTDVLNW